MLAGVGVATIAFVGWELHAKTRLIDPVNVRMGAFLAALGVSSAAGVALMVTLVDVDLFAQSLLDRDDRGAVILLLRFLVALPVGALLGGLLTARLGDRVVAAAGMLAAAVGYLQMARWPMDVLSASYQLGPIAMPRLDTDLAIAGLGLGLVIAPLSVAVLRAVPSTQHGIASAGVVVARMTGMLVGVAALSAWGLHRFHSLTANLQVPFPVGKPPEQAARELAEYTAAVDQALLTQYTEIFLITSAVCVAGALLALFLGRRPAQAPDSGENSITKRT
jgi:hypothetical protein